jgi:nitrite reductase/ring-hydroxylating ferredoxin subunit
MGDQKQISTAMLPDPELTARRNAEHARLRRELVTHLRNGTTDMAPGGARQIDPAAYTDPERFKAERRAVFLNYPTMAALSAEMPNPGDTMLYDELGPNILLTRNRDGKVNAFLNMCTHRAAKVVTECGRKNLMTCRFHGWSFDLNGRLAGFPGAEGFAGIDRDKLGLIRVPVGEKYGMIFVKGVAGTEEIDVDAHLGTMAPLIAELELEKVKPISKGNIDAAANWKYVYDTYYEGYHFATLHKDTIGSLAVSNVMTTQMHGPHIRMGMPRAEFKPLVDMPESDWPVSEYGGLYMIFPNISLNVYAMKDGGQFYGIARVFPGPTVGTSRTVQLSCRAAHSNPEVEDARWVEIHEFVRGVVQNEDYSVSEDGQRNLEYAPAGFRPVLGANELAVQHMHRTVEQLIAPFTSK